MAWVTRAPSLSLSERKVSLCLSHFTSNMTVLMHCPQNSKQSIHLFSSDISPTGQGVDHRQVQRELGEVAVQLQDPLMLTAASMRVSWAVRGFLWSFVSFRQCFSLILFSNLPNFTFNSSRLTVSLSLSRATVSSTDPVEEPGSSRTSTCRLNAALYSPICTRELSTN